MFQKKETISHPVRFTSLGEYLRQQRLKLCLSQEALAEALGVSARSVRRWEQDQAIPQEVARERLCKFFGVETRSLFGAWNNEETPSLREQALGEHFLEITQTLHDFAAFQKAQGKYQEAALLYRRALATREQLLGVEHPTTLATRTKYLALLQSMDQEDKF